MYRRYNKNMIILHYREIKVNVRKAPKAVIGRKRRLMSAAVTKSFKQTLDEISLGICFLYGAMR
jgi:hypothetical protein